MCGIFGYIGKKENAAEIILEGLKRLEYRGYDSWGVAVVPTEDPNKNNKIVVKKRIGKIGDANSDDSFNIFDLVALIEQLNNEGPYSSQTDIDKNGKNNIYDLLALLKLFSFLQTEPNIFPCTEQQP